ncbi:phage shock protein C (PspC) family protein [Saccharicrinis carchari]|uniref:Phage shock protein C (PspC) family protein n=1 Tax=Saccharicrinis carchari TaxID=1168039 RepID=A0A521BZN6_SACCC|nr:PspC domain-containing protein [Saccharicrinis carchari]SMO52613.1 phage shock protein C (PspC) family protein [Saccharicrinis carchari]
MKKTLYINLNGFAFHIDEDAYEKLNQYLKNIERSFSDKEEAKEIVSDIEARIAELFHSKKQSMNEVITLGEVEEVMGTIGQPQDIANETEEEENYQRQPSGEMAPPLYGKRLYRDPDNRVLGGVCGGLGAYFNVDPLVFRILFLFTFFFYGSSLLVYIVLWIAMPEAITITEKLQMKGPAGYERWEENLRNEYREVSDRFKRSKAYQGSSGAFSRGSDTIGNAISGLLQALAVIIGAVLMITTLIVLVSLIFAFTFGFTFLDFSGVGNYLTSLPSLFISGKDMIFGSIGLVLVTCIPVVALFYLGFRLVFRFKSRIKFAGLASLALWVIGLIMLFYASARVAGDFAVSHDTYQKELLQLPNDSIIYLKPNPAVYNNQLKNHLFDVNQLDVYADNKKFYVQGSPRIELVSGREYSIEIMKSARGKTIDQAQKNCDDIEFFWMQEDAVLNVDAIFTLQEESKIRNQKLKVILTVPQDVTVNVDDELEWMVYNRIN